MDEDYRVGTRLRGGETRDVSLRFTGSGGDILGWGIVWLLSYFAFSIPRAWWHRSYNRWMTRHVETADGSVVTFVGDPKAIWYWFPLWGTLSIAQHLVHARWLVTTLSVIEILFSMVIAWIVARWFAEGLRLSETIGFRFTGSLRTFLGWQILTTLSLLTVVGWAWVNIAFQRWLYRHMESDDAELKMVGRPLVWLGIGAFCFLLPLALILIASQLPLGKILESLLLLVMGLDLAGDTSALDLLLESPAKWVIALWIISIPWLQAWVMRWFICNTRLIVTAPAPLPAEAPALVE